VWGGAFPPSRALVCRLDVIGSPRLLSERRCPARQEFSGFRKGEVFRHLDQRRAASRYEDVLVYAQIVSGAPAVLSEALFVPTEGSRPLIPSTASGHEGAHPGGGARPPIDQGERDLPGCRSFWLTAPLADEALPGRDPAHLRSTCWSRSPHEELLVRPRKAASSGKTLEVRWLVPGCSFRVRRGDHLSRRHPGYRGHPGNPAVLTPASLSTEP